MNLAPHPMFGTDAPPMVAARVARDAALSLFRARPATAVISAAVLGYVIGRLVMR